MARPKLQIIFGEIMFSIEIKIQGLNYKGWTKEPIWYESVSKFNVTDAEKILTIVIEPALTWLKKYRPDVSQLRWNFKGSLQGYYVLWAPDLIL